MVLELKNNKDLQGLLEETLEVLSDFKLNNKQTFTKRINLTRVIEDLEILYDDVKYKDLNEETEYEKGYSNGFDDGYQSGCEQTSYSYSD